MSGCLSAHIEELVKVFREIKRILKDDGTLWINIGDSYNSSPSNQNGQGLDGKTRRGNKPIGRQKRKIENLKPKDLIGIPWMLAFALRKDGWYLRQDIIWHKPNSMPESVIDRCVKSHEYIFLLSKQEKYYFNYKAIQVPAEYDGRKDTLGVKYKKSVVPGQVEQTASSKGSERWQTDKHGNFISNKRSVWKVPTCNFKEAHFATFPEKLIEPCILAGCPENGVVLDPFFGAGTTGVVAIQHFRKYIGIELNPDYIKIAEKRIKEAQPFKKRFDAFGKERLEI